MKKRLVIACLVFAFLIILVSKVGVGLEYYCYDAEGKTCNSFELKLGDLCCYYKSGGGTAEGGTCPEGYTNCNGDCVNISIDPMNCGECGNVCEGGDGLCSFATCTPTEMCTSISPTEETCRLSGTCTIVYLGNGESCGACEVELDSGYGESTYYAPAMEKVPIMIILLIIPINQQDGFM